MNGIEAYSEGKLGVEKPMGFTYFYSEYHRRNKVVVEEPYILRFAFQLRTPAQYSKFLNTYVDVKLGKKRYMTAWNLSRPVVGRNMQRLEAGEKMLVVEKNLFNTRYIEKEEESDDPDIYGEDDDDFERITFVWLPKSLKKFRTIALTFRRFDERDDREYPKDPTFSSSQRIPILV